MNKCIAVGRERLGAAEAAAEAERLSAEERHAELLGQHSNTCCTASWHGPAWPSDPSH